MTTSMSEGVGWLKKHLVELLLTAVLALVAWDAKQIQKLAENQALMQKDVVHINKAVNNVSSDESSLRDIVKDNQVSIGILLDRTKRRYEESAAAPAR